jgi:hypothetical protein
MVLAFFSSKYLLLALNILASFSCNQTQSYLNYRRYLEEKNANTMRDKEMENLKKIYDSNSNKIKQNDTLLLK